MVLSLSNFPGFPLTLNEMTYATNLNYQNWRYQGLETFLVNRFAKSDLVSLLCHDKMPYSLARIQYHEKDTCKEWEGRCNGFPSPTPTQN